MMSSVEARPAYSRSSSSERGREQRSSHHPQGSVAASRWRDAAICNSCLGTSTMRSERFRRSEGKLGSFSGWDRISDHSRLEASRWLVDTGDPARRRSCSYCPARLRQYALCIPYSRSRKIPYDYDKALYRQRHKVENLFAKLEDWRRIATRYDRCARTFFSASCIAAAVILWI